MLVDIAFKWLQRLTTVSIIIAVGLLLLNIDTIESRMARFIEAKIELITEQGNSTILAENKSLKARLRTAELWIESLRSQIDGVHESAATISSDGISYDIAQTRHGAFLIIARSIVPHLDGYKIHLDVGNMTSATMNGAKVHVVWATYTRTSDFNVTTKFTPGMYSGFDIFLSPAKPEEVKTLIISLEFNNVELRRPLAQ
jgi:hypothetical protein